MTALETTLLDIVNRDNFVTVTDAAKEMQTTVAKVKGVLGSLVKKDLCVAKTHWDYEWKKTRSGAKRVAVECQLAMRKGDY